MHEISGLVIAGGPWQMPLVQYFKTKGHRVAVVNPVVNDTTRCADLHIQADIRDVETISAEMTHLKPAFVTSDQSDVATRIVAQLSDKHVLPGNPPKIVKLFTDKFDIFRFARSLGIPVPETALVVGAEDIRRFATRHGYPVVVKPVDATNSRGVRKLESAAEVDDRAYSVARVHSDAGVIVQRFIPGTLATAEGVCSGGKHRTLALSSKKDWFAPGFNSNVVYPARLPQEVLQRIGALNDLYVGTPA